MPPARFVTDAQTTTLYQFDEGEGTVLRDRSGRSIHGSITGGRWVKALIETKGEIIEYALTG